MHRQSAPPASRASGPGAFGKAAPATSQQPRNTSAMSRDVDQSAASANALKTLDERRAAAAAAAAANRPAPMYGPSGPQPVYAPVPPGYQTVPQPGNGLMQGILGFMLGRAISQSNQPVAYPTVQQPAPQQPAASGPDGMVGGMPGLNAPAQVPVPQPSFAHRVLRWLVWLTVVSVMFWAVVYAVRKLRRLRAPSNYSFERN